MSTTAVLVEDVPVRFGGVHALAGVDLAAPTGSTLAVLGHNGAGTPSPARCVTMGCGDACPLFPGRRYEDWQLDDPAGRDVAAVRPIRDEIRVRVEELMASLGITATLA